MKPEQLIKLFKTGKFTIIYWDNTNPTLYKGVWNMDKEFDRDEYATMNKSEIKIEMHDMNGYCPNIVTWLAQALGGKTDSI